MQKKGIQTPNCEKNKKEYDLKPVIERMLSAYTMPRHTAS